jgi:hypothetical protein
MWLLLVVVTVGCATQTPHVAPETQASPTKSPLVRDQAEGRKKIDPTPPPEQDSRKAYRDIKFDLLATGKEVKIRIRSQGPLFDFPEGASYFRAFELPPESSTYSLEVTSRLVGSKQVGETHVFYPTLLFLDQDFRVVLALDPALKPLTTRKYGDVFTARLTRLPQARYLVFYTDKSRLQEKMYIRMGAHPEALSYTTPSPGASVTAEGMHHTRRGATGQLHLRLER